MDVNWVRNMLITQIRQRGFTLEEARADALRGMGPLFADAVDAAVKLIQEECRAIRVVETVPGVVNPLIGQDLKESAWYPGPAKGDKVWPALRARLESSELSEALGSIDEASTKVVAHLAPPRVRGVKKKGLVLGYVQSGKTANYTAVMAKAADANYRLFVVLSGMHNNLRRQTQARIDRDLGTNAEPWVALTNAEADFGNKIDGNALMSSRDLRLLAVVKKNGTRLKNLRDWLRDIDPEIRARTPILIIDDEADQATPNTLAAKEEISGINRLVREIWAEVGNGTYVGYTATPFANIFMDPDDVTDLYPEDFIFDLPRSDEHFGAEQLFGRTVLHEGDEPDDGYDVVRDIPDEDALSLKPPSRGTAREKFDPPLPPSLQTAIRWFVLATAVRRTRGQGAEHSSMLVNTTTYVKPHEHMSVRIRDFVERLRRELYEFPAEWELLFVDEIDRAYELSHYALPNWEHVWEELPGVLDCLRVVVDNGYSHDRLDYDRRDEFGKPIAEVVIAVGGSTLSRGLTLKGLVASYFVRTANTYDTLMQMGRWFGFRPGYEDLPRIWATPQLQEEYRFLASVEDELRREMAKMEALNVTPGQFGVKVRAHPGRLSITQRNKMVHAERVKVSYEGQRIQTIVLHETDRQALETNLDAARHLAQASRLHAQELGRQDPARTQFRGVAQQVVLDFLGSYRFHADQPGLRKDHLLGWLRQAEPFDWNVTFVGTGARPAGAGAADGSRTVDLGLAHHVTMVTRAPLKRPGPGVANIKALMSTSDWIVDLDGDLSSGAGLRTVSDFEDFRRTHAGGRASLIVYLVDPHSAPSRETARKSRRVMEAEVPIVALGLIFPDRAVSYVAKGASYYTVRPDWTVADEDDQDQLPIDTEGSVTITAADVEALSYGR